MPAKNQHTHAWTPEQDRMLRQAYGSGDLDSLCLSLDRTRTAIKSRAKVLGLRRDRKAAKVALTRTLGGLDSEGVVKSAIRRRSALEKVWQPSLLSEVQLP